MNITDLGFFAATLTTFAFFPQTYQSWKTKDLRGISLTMYSMFTVGVILWIIYGYRIHSWPIMIANIVTLFSAGSILFLKIQESKQSKSSSTNAQN